MIDFAVVEITDKCNLQCKHCYGAFEGETTISESDLKNVIAQLKENNCTRVTLSGGEPCVLQDRLFDIANEFKQAAFKVALVTNGTLLGENVKRYSCFDIIQVSIDGTKEIHESIRGVATFDKAINGILELRKYVSNVFAQMTVNSINQYNFFELLKYLEKRNIILSVERASPQGRATLLDDIDYENYDKILDTVLDKNLLSTNPMVNAKKCAKNNIFCSTGYKLGCSAAKKGIAIDPKLNVFPCVRIRDVLGNLRLTTLSEILKSSKRYYYCGINSTPYRCRKCAFLNVCGGCKADSLFTNKCRLYVPS